jgi:hypothetical protein
LHPFHPDITSCVDTCRVEDCFEKDEMARVTGDTLNISFLREGVVPEVDMNLYLQVRYFKS